MINQVTVYCASSDDVDSKYLDVAEEAGKLLADRNYGLVYGGGQVGLMGAIARSVHRHGGRVIGIIPEALKEREGVAYEVADELIITKTMQERKAILFTRADAFMVLPGGFGTLEEFMEVLTLKQLGYHNKPLALLNVDGYYDPLLDLFEHFFDEGFAAERYRTLYFVTGSAEEALAYMEGRDGRA